MFHKFFYTFERPGNPAGPRIIHRFVKTILFMFF